MGRLRQAAGLAAMLAVLGGCQGRGTIGAGEQLFHGLQGGLIAQQRPPPPGVNDPFPNLGSIPVRPPAPDIVAEQRIADQLAAQRDQAEASAAANPLTPRAPPPALPKPSAPDPNANRVVVDAAPATAPAPARSVPAQLAPAAANPAAIPTLASVPALATPVVAGPLPSLAAAPPPAPVNIGLPIPVTASAAPGPILIDATGSPALAPAAPPGAAAAASKPLLDTLLSQTVVPVPVGDTLYAPPPPPTAPNTVGISFTPGSATLPPSASLNLRRFALAHKGVGVTVTGHGGAVLPGADSQSRALDLALRRAQAIAASLATAGVPAVNLHLHAEAAGQGGSVSL